MKINKIIVLSVCGLLVVAVISAGAFWFLRNEKKSQLRDFSGQTPEQIRAYLRSKDFNSLDDQTRRMVGRAARIAMMNYRVNEYFSLPENKRTAYLDKMIDEIEARRAEFQARRPDPNDRRLRQFRRNAEAQRARMESVDPLTRAKREAFREAMRTRMQQRGINSDGGRGRG